MMKELEALLYASIVSKSMRVVSALMKELLRRLPCVIIDVSDPNVNRVLMKGLHSVRRWLCSDPECKALCKKSKTAMTISTNNDSDTGGGVKSRESGSPSPSPSATTIVTRPARAKSRSRKSSIAGVNLSNVANLSSVPSSSSSVVVASAPEPPSLQATTNSTNMRSFAVDNIINYPAKTEPESFTQPRVPSPLPLQHNTGGPLTSSASFTAPSLSYFNVVKHNASDDGPGPPVVSVGRDSAGIGIRGGNYEDVGIVRRSESIAHGYDDVRLSSVGPGAGAVLNQDNRNESRTSGQKGEIMVDFKVATGRVAAVLTDGERAASPVEGCGGGVGDGWDGQRYSGTFPWKRKETFAESEQNSFEDPSSAATANMSPPSKRFKSIDTRPTTSLGQSDIVIKQESEFSFPPPNTPPMHSQSISTPIPAPTSTSPTSAGARFRSPPMMTMFTAYNGPNGPDLMNPFRKCHNLKKACRYHKHSNPVSPEAPRVSNFDVPFAISGNMLRHPYGQSPQQFQQQYQHHPEQQHQQQQQHCMLPPISSTNQLGYSSVAGYGGEVESSSFQYQSGEGYRLPMSVLHDHRDAEETMTHLYSGTVASRSCD
ncbi:hypothetical protein HDU76_006754 [Blyttiomyces sp. JEL0837]|nr:hypothetical protein HDU76_006754 [Blyttiomyces sp. JEL0837]